MAEVERPADVVQLVDLALIVTGPDGRRAAALAELLNAQPGVIATVDAEPGDPCDAVIIAVAGDLEPTPTELAIAESIERATRSAIVACLVDGSGIDDHKFGADQQSGAAQWPVTVRTITVPPTTEGAAALVAAAQDLESIDPGLDPQNTALDFRNDAARAERSRRIRANEKQRRHTTRTLFSKLDQELAALTGQPSDAVGTVPTESDLQRAARRLNRSARRRGVLLNLTVPAAAAELTAPHPVQRLVQRRAETAIAAVAGAAAGAGIGRGILAIVNIWVGNAPWFATVSMAVAGLSCAALAAGVQLRAYKRQQAQRAAHQLAETLKRTWTSAIAAACDAVDAEADAAGWRYRQLTKGVTNG